MTITQTCGSLDDYKIYGSQAWCVMKFEKL